MACLPIAAIVLLWLLYFWRILTPNLADRLTFQHGDFTMQFLAYRQMAFRQIVAGHFPSFEECLYSGYPFQADPQSQVLYPPVMAMMQLGRVLGWAEYPLRALEWEVMLHVLLAALGMYAFLRGGALRPPHRLAALFGAVAYAFGGFMTGYAMLQTGILETAAWTPLILLLLRQTIFRQLWLTPALLLALCVVCAFTAGHPQSLLFILYTGAAAFLFWRAQAQSTWKGALGRVALAGTLAIGLSAAQLIPQLLFAQISTRASISYPVAGNGFQISDLWMLLTIENFIYWQPLYIGVLGMLMALAGLRNRRFSERWLWLIVLSVALILSFGSNALGFDIFYLLAPGYGQFRSQERHAAVASFALCVLATYGLDGLLLPLRTRALVRLRRESGRLATLAVVAAMMLVAIKLYGSAKPEDVGALANRVGLVMIGLIGLAGALFWRAYLNKANAAALQWRWVWGLLPMALLVFDLFSTTRGTSTQAMAPPFPESKLIAAIAPEEKNIGRLYNHYGLDFNMACINGLREIGGGSPIVLKTYDSFLKRVSEDVYSKLLNVRYTVTWRGGMGTDNGRVIPSTKIADDQFNNGDIHLFKLQWEPQKKGEAWLTNQPLWVNDDEAAYTALNADGFDPFKQVVLLESNRAAANGLVPDDATFDQSQVGIDGNATGYLKASAYTTSPAVLVVSRAYHPNWVALVNGAEVKPLRVNAALIGVPVPAGNSTIELSYRPTDLYVGAAISAATLLGMAALGLWASRRRR